MGKGIVKRRPAGMQIGASNRKWDIWVTSKEKFRDLRKVLDTL